MLIDTIMKLKESYRLRKNSKLGEETLNDLSTYIFRGDYAKVKNKEYILKYWLIHSPQCMAKELDITVKEVYYLKKRINEQLVKELGADLLPLISKEKFYEIGNRIRLSQKRLNTDSALPQYINNLVSQKVMKSNLKTPKENELEYHLKETLNDRSTTSIFSRELAFMKIYRKVAINHHLNLLNPVLLNYLIQITANKKEDLELKNMLFQYLNDSH